MCVETKYLQSHPFSLSPLLSSNLNVEFRMSDLNLGKARLGKCSKSNLQSFGTKHFPGRAVAVQYIFRVLWPLKSDLKVDSNLGKIKYLTMTDASKVWMPDTFFRNEKIGRFHTILTPNLYVRVFPNGNVLYSIR